MLTAGNVSDMKAAPALLQRAGRMRYLLATKAMTLTNCGARWEREALSRSSLAAEPQAHLFHPGIWWCSLLCSGLGHFAHDVDEVLPKLVVAVVVAALDRCLLDSPVLPFDLTCPIVHPSRHTPMMHHQMPGSNRQDGATPRDHVGAVSGEGAVYPDGRHRKGRRRFPLISSSFWFGARSRSVAAHAQSVP